MIAWLIEKNYQNNLSEVMNLVHSSEQSELFENIVLNLGNLVCHSENVRIKLFSTNVMDLALMRFKIFEKRSSTAEYMIWMMSNTLNHKFHLNEDLQFDLMRGITRILMEHQTSSNLIETIWAMRFFMERQSRVVERVQLLAKLNLPNLLSKYIRQKLGLEDCPTWMSGAFEALREFYSIAGSSLCDSEFISVRINNSVHNGCSCKS